MNKLFSSSVLISACFSPLSHANDKLEEVFVTGSRTEIPLRQVGTSATIISAEEIELKSQPTLLDLLRSEAGISGSNTGGLGKTSSLSIRGEEGYRTLFLVDGIEVSDPSGTQASTHIEHLTATNEIEKIEILRGPQAFVYGADAGGVVSIFTKSGADELNGKVSLEAGSYNTTTLNGYVAGGSDQFDGFASVTQINSDGFSARDESIDSTQDDDGYENTTLHTKLGWNVDDSIRIQLVARDISASSEFDGCWNTELSRSTQNCEGKNDQTSGRLSFAYDANKFALNAAYSQTKIERENISDGISSYATEGQIKKAELLGNVELTSSWNLLIGGEQKTETSQPNGAEEQSREQSSGFYELQGSVSESFYVTGGARYDDNDDFGTHISTRVSAAYLMSLDSNTLKFRASYGTGFRAPSLYEVNYNAANGGDNLSEEQSDGFDIGVDFYLANGTVITLNHFDQTIEDAIFYDSALGDTGWGAYGQDEGESTSKGYELDIAYSLIKERVFLDFTYTYNNAERPDGTQRFRRPKNSGGLGIRWKADAMNVSVDYQVSQDRVDYPGDIELEDYCTLNANLDYAVSDSLSVFARAQNMLDEEYKEASSYNTSGAAGYLGVRFTF